ncbi:hypothetical protein E3P92_00594 [Wallemia ichthyophaga]|uniref:Centrosomin N-terminal motif 1 domain-containing protein n=2 Tax=Wallemia ichthyophaga TaxID=245174 RepID=A0A4T0EZG2_WALIC|nr:Anucleate primary sterigmata protein B [Wallemia ichthyophaga EXF-994]TIA75824.1 hypothetical protein E3P91_00254 [Wallemia ichthyophaga]EOQ99612.1 Anucleate primary sterigmata protein B [Wallemia ichthyophaga EXF-994]TIA80548.1 hypothetical protein E3P98_02625 [Wallemia ichthyophaga]TIA93274.1 hypothetical protein E3P97_00984 [Wallemia ichthyophaga]TIB01125.1 hypothetical protein E3P96_02456 [Wallemia ichthyophaga]
MAHALASASGLDASNSHVNIYDTQKSLAEMSLGALEPSFKSEDEREIQQKTQPKQDHEMLIERENQHDVEVEEGHEQQQLSDDELKFPHVEDGGEDDLTSVQVPLADSSNSQLFDKSTASLKSKSRTGSSRRESGGKPMTLKEQEETIDQAKRENWSLKLKIVLLENRLNEVAPEQVNDALKENIQLKIDSQNMRMDLKRNRTLALKLEKAIEALKDENKKQKIVIDSNQRSKPSPSASKNLEDMVKNAQENEQEVRTLLEMSNERERELKEHIHTLESQLDRNIGEGAESHHGWSDGEDARAEISRLRDEVLVERDTKEDIIASRVELENQLMETTEEIERLRMEAEANEDNSVDLDSAVSVRRNRQKRKPEDLEKEKNSLETQVQAQLQLIESRDNEIEELYAHVERLESHIENNTSLRNSMKMSSNSDPRVHYELEKLDIECNELRDRLSEAHVELDRRETEIEGYLRDQEDKFHDYINEYDRERKYEKEELHSSRLRLEEYEAKIATFEDSQEHIQQEIDQYLEKMQGDLHERNEELLAANDEVSRISEQNIQLENELDIVCARFEALESDLLEMQQRLDQEQDIQDRVTFSLKEKIEITHEQKRELEKAIEKQMADMRQTREVSDDLALRLAEREEQSRQELEQLRQLEYEFESLATSMKEEKDGRERDRIFYGREKRDLEMEHKRAIEHKTTTLEDYQTQVQQLRSQLSAREEDYQKLQSRMKKMMSEHQELGDSHTNDRATLEMEIERLERDGARYVADIEQLRSELERKDKMLEERERGLHSTNSESRELSYQLKAELQTNAYNIEKLHTSQQQYQDALEEVTRLKDRLREVDSRLMREEKGVNVSESQYKQQVTERNTLLLTIYQYMEKLVGPSDRKHSDARPYNNFNAFHENVISKMRKVSSLQLKFDSRAKEIESKWMDKFAALRKQIDGRWKQLDGLEGSVKSAAEMHKQWRLKANEKSRELDEIKNSYNETMIQLANAKSKLNVSNGDTGEVRALTARATTAERRLNITQNQMSQVEEKLIEARNKMVESDNKWSARAKEFENKMKAAEDKVKRERVGAKDRVNDLEKNIEELNKQIEGASKRNTTIQSLVGK